MILCAENICFIIHKICQKGWKRKKSIEKLPTTLKGVSKQDKQIVLLDQFYFSMKKKLCLLTLDMEVQTQEDKQIALLDQFNKFVTCIKCFNEHFSPHRQRQRQRHHNHNDYLVKNPINSWRFEVHKLEKHTYKQAIWVFKSLCKFSKS